MLLSWLHSKGSCTLTALLVRSFYFLTDVNHQEPFSEVIYGEVNAHPMAFTFMVVLDDQSRAWFFFGRITGNLTSAGRLFEYLSLVFDRRIPSMSIGVNVRSELFRGKDWSFCNATISFLNATPCVSLMIFSSVFFRSVAVYSPRSL